MKTSRRFLPIGNNVQKCKCCKRAYRVTEEVRFVDGICEDDYELAGIYNVLQDGGDVQPYAGEIRQRTSRIVELGGQLDGDAIDLLEIVNAGVQS